MQSVLVVGAGYMGTGISQVCAQAGYRVHLTDTNPAALTRAMAEIRSSLSRLANKGLLNDSPEEISGLITMENDLHSAANVDWIIEAVLEMEKVKCDLFRELDELASKITPLATNTSTIPITRLAQSTQHPERVLGLHFFGPVPLMELVEVVKGEKTSPTVFENGVAFIRSLGKTPVRVNKDIPGFVMNRIFSAAFREAIDLAAEGIASIEDIDVGMKKGYGWNVGPFEIADNAGLDTFLLVGQSMKELGEEHLVAHSDLLQRIVKEGNLGRKTGKGFYEYTSDGKRLPK